MTKTPAREVSDLFAGTDYSLIVYLGSYSIKRGNSHVANFNSILKTFYTVSPEIGEYLDKFIEDNGLNGYSVVLTYD